MIEAGGDVLVRLSWKSLRLLDTAGQPLGWMALYERGKAMGGIDMPVRVVKPRGRFTPLPITG